MLFPLSMEWDTSIVQTLVCKTLLSLMTKLALDWMLCSEIS